MQIKIFQNKDPYINSLRASHPQTNNNPLPKLMHMNRGAVKYMYMYTFIPGLYIQVYISQTAVCIIINITFLYVLAQT